MPKSGMAQHHRDSHRPIKVLFVLHQGIDALDFIGPLEVLSQARYTVGSKGKIKLPIEAHILYHYTFRTLVHHHETNRMLMNSFTDVRTSSL